MVSAGRCPWSAGSGFGSGPWRRTLRARRSSPGSVVCGPRGEHRSTRSAGDGQLVANVGNAAGHPGGVDHGVVLGPGADVPGERHRGPAGGHLDVAVVADHRVALQHAPDEEKDVSRIHTGVDIDVVLDIPDAGQLGDRPFGRGTLGTGADDTDQLEGMSVRLVRGDRGRLGTCSVVQRGCFRGIPGPLRVSVVLTGRDGGGGGRYRPVIDGERASLRG